MTLIRKAKWSRISNLSTSKEVGQEDPWDYLIGELCLHMSMRACIYTENAWTEKSTRDFYTE